MDIFNLFNFGYWLVLALVIFIETTTLGQIWKRREVARWTLGYFTVFALSAPLVALGVWDPVTWIGLFFGVGISGAVKVGYQQWRESRQAEKLRDMPVVVNLEGMNEQNNRRR